jgi:hypothetical protein
MEWQGLGPSWKVWLADIGVPVPGLAYQPDDDVNKRLLGGDPAAVPVLLELRQHPEPVVRQVAALGLARVGTGHAAVVPALEGLTADEDSRVRWIVRHALRSLRRAVERDRGR